MKYYVYHFLCTVFFMKRVRVFLLKSNSNDCISYKNSMDHNYYHNFNDMLTQFWILVDKMSRNKNYSEFLLEIFVIMMYKLFKIFLHDSIFF